jgi:cobalt-zinc-cadmium efflux system membrane fusion protein
VVEREVTLGELVSPEKEALLVLANLDMLWVLADVPEARLQEIAVGGKVRVTVGTGEGTPFSGTVAFISPAVDPSTRSAQVRVEVQDGHLALRPGMFARVEIETRPTGGKQDAVLAVPDEAVQTVEGGPAVFVAVAGEENTFAKRAITVGRAIGGMVPVLSGLKEGESCVVAGSFLMKADLGKGSASHED